MQRIWCGRAIGAPIRSSPNSCELFGRAPLPDEIGDAGQPVAAEERLVEVIDHIRDVDVVAVVDPDNWSFGADWAETHQVHIKLLEWKVIMILPRSGVAWRTMRFSHEQLTARIPARSRSQMTCQD